MCPICLGVAAWATIAGSGSAGGLATIFVARRRIRRDARAGRRNQRLDALAGFLEQQKESDDDRS